MKQETGMGQRRLGIVVHSFAAIGRSVRNRGMLLFGWRAVDATQLAGGVGNEMIGGVASGLCASVHGRMQRRVDCILVRIEWLWHAMDGPALQVRCHPLPRMPTNPVRWTPAH